MKIVCALRLAPDAFPHQEFALFRQRFFDARSREAEDVSSGSWVSPLELREQVEWMIETGVGLDDARALKLLSFLTEVGVVDSFWNQELNRCNSENRS